MNGGEHQSEDRSLGRARAAASRLEAEAAQELVSDLALPVDVGAGRDSTKPDRRDDLTASDLLADAHVDGARVVVADGQVAVTTPSSPAPSPVPNGAAISTPV